jgi:ribose 5-phosphate isomerase A
MTASTERDRQKRAAAMWAAEAIEDGMVVGLGSGTTADMAIEVLAARVAKGLRIVGIPTSERTAALARNLGLPLTDFAAHRRIDIAIDGADQVKRSTLELIKGHGGALLREKIVASASDRMIVVVDETKLVDQLGGKTPLPVEIANFGWQTVLDRLAALGCKPVLRLADAKPFVTDGGNYIADCVFGQIPDAAALHDRLSRIVGVIENGLFIGLASTIVVGGNNGVEIMDR